MRKSKAMSSKTSTLDSVASFKRAPRDIQDLEFLEKLGDGLFGVVWRARNVYSGEVVAVKKFNSSNVAAKLEFLKEAKIIKTLRHENLLRFLAMFVVQDERLACGSGLYLVTEFCEGGDLAKRLADDSHPLSWRDRVHFALDIARGLAHLHKNNVIHRDLKCENCLIYPTPTSKSLTSSPATPAAATSHERTSMPKQGSQMGAAPHSAPGSPPLPRHAVRPRVVLADFGLARWHASLDGSDKPSKMTVCGTPYTVRLFMLEVIRFASLSLALSVQLGSRLPLTMHVLHKHTSSCYSDILV
jgi:serine/threonine protein kinase